MWLTLSEKRREWKEISEGRERPHYEGPDQYKKKKDRKQEINDRFNR